MTLAIRTAGPADRGTCVDLIDALNAVEATLVDDRLTTRAAAEAAYAAAVERVARTKGRMLLAEEDGHPVGLLVFVIEEEHPYVREDVRRYGQVADLIVVEDARGRGIGRALLSQAEALTREAGLKRLAIGALAANAAAVGAYRRAGFGDYLTILVKDVS
ncbi:GNAT family N-acetyltransferase [Salinarimonas rosea]|uniref:GNAT family N-acetyltransferase n=1 Tax=Salinarimonas rosea TaxID=552063 RepID=UPI00041D8DEE|nr:GNAT family N-acetyltransferase [Salinarimonas rosea]